MKVDKVLKEELDSLSLDIWGVESKWQTMVKKGVQESVTIDEVVDDENGNAKVLKRQALYYSSKTPVITLKYYTPEEMVVKLRELKAQKDAFLAAMEEQKQAEIKKRELAKNAELLRNSTSGDVS